jgi:hypothetical protein
MKYLSNVTLIAYDNTEYPERTVSAMRHCRQEIEFACAVIVSNTTPRNLQDEVFELVPDCGYRAAMDFEVNRIHRYVETDFALFVSHDGYIQNPSAWQDEWLCFDFIGAPWPQWLCGRLSDPSHRVGNTGFCLKSKRFMQLCFEFGANFDPSTPGDVYTSDTIRTQLEKSGMKYAPIEIASDFSWELNTEEFPKGRFDAFGFHDFAGKVART